MHELKFNMHLIRTLNCHRRKVFIKVRLRQEQMSIDICVLNQLNTFINFHLEIFTRRIIEILNEGAFFVIHRFRDGASCFVVCFAGYSLDIFMNDARNQCHYVSQMFIKWCDIRHTSDTFIRLRLRFRLPSIISVFSRCHMRLLQNYIKRKPLRVLQIALLRLHPNFSAITGVHIFDGSCELDG